MHVLLAQRHRQWPRFDLPESRGEISVVDVLRAAPGAERGALIRQWAACVWNAYRARRDRVIRVLGTSDAAGEVASGPGCKLPLRCGERASAPQSEGGTMAA